MWQTGFIRIKNEKNINVTKINRKENDVVNKPLANH